RADALQRRGIAVRRDRPGGPAPVPHAVHLLAARIDEFEAFPLVAERAAERPGRVEAVVFAELLEVLADDQVAVRLDLRPGGELVLDAPAELPAAQIHRPVARVV